MSRAFAKASSPWTLLAVAMVIPFSGCAAAYHDYSSRCIPYAYCQPQALPYVAYEDGHCPTPRAWQQSQQQSGISGNAAPDSGVPMEAPTASEQDEPAAFHSATW